MHIRTWTALIVGGAAAAALLVGAGPGSSDREPSAPVPAEERAIDVAQAASSRS